MFGRKKPEVLVVGAGPVGLFAALALAQREVPVQIVDKEWRPAAHSYALALHPHTLALLDQAGLLDPVLAQAYRIHTIGLYDGPHRRAELRLSDLDAPFPMLAVTRQDVLENLLEDALRRRGVKVRWNSRVAMMAPADDHVDVTIDQLERGSTGYAVYHTEWIIARTKDLAVPFVVGADGHLSDVRRRLEIDFPDAGETQHFAVFEFKTDADLGHEMRVVLDDRTANVLWPLPDGRCRWSFQLTDYEAPPATRRKLAYHIGAQQYPVLSEDSLHALIAERAPWFEGRIDGIDWRIVVRFERRLACAFGQQRMWLAGDAAHTTGPVGVQSMNVGLREAYDLAGILVSILHEGAPMERLHAYDRERMVEWRRLLGLDDGPTPGARADAWIRRRASRLLPCLPASGDHLGQLAQQVGLHA